MDTSKPVDLVWVTPLPIAQAKARAALRRWPRLLMMTVAAGALTVLGIYWLSNVSRPDIVFPWRAAAGAWTLCSALAALVGLGGIPRLNVVKYRLTAKGLQSNAYISWKRVRAFAVLPYPGAAHSRALWLDTGWHRPVIIPLSDDLVGNAVIEAVAQRVPRNDGMWRLEPNGRIRRATAATEASRG